MPKSPNNISRTRRILDVLDSLASTASIADTSPNTSVAHDMLNTRKWLHDISVGKTHGGGPPRTTLRTPSRLYSIVSHAREKPYWKRPTEMAAAAATKKKEVSFEADLEPGESDVASKRINNSELPKSHQPVLKSYTGRNVAGSVKSNIFNTNFVDLEADISSEKTKKALESVRPPSEFGKNLARGFLTKDRVFGFAKPVIRGPQVVLEKSFEKEESSSDEISVDDEESDKEVETISTKAINSDTSSSSPENSKIQKSQTPVAKEQLPLPITNAAGSWDCSTCMVNNAASEEKCVCCETPKEGIAGNGAPQPLFKPTEFKPVPASVSFGFKPASTAASDSKPENTPSFGFKQTNTSVSNPKPTETPLFGFNTASDSKATDTPPFGFKTASDSKPENTPTFGFKQTNTSVSDSKPTGTPIFGFKTSSDSKPADTPAFGFKQTNTAATDSKPEDAPVTGFKQTNNAASDFKPFSSLEQQNVFTPGQVNNSTLSKPTSALFTFNTAAPVAGFNFGGSEKPATNGAFQLNGSSNNLFNGAPTNTATASTAPPPSFSALGQQNSFMPGDSNNSTLSKPITATPFTFNTAAPVAGFNFGGFEQPSTNGTFQFNGSSSNLFNSTLTNAATAFATPAPSFPTLGQQNSFMPPGNSMSSNSRKLLLAKRTRKR